MNPYLARLREQYEALRTGIEGLQTRAAETDRDLTEDELRSIQEQGETAARLATQISDLTAIETRNRQVAETAAQVDADVAADRTRSGSTRVGSAQTRDRDPGHYRRDGQHGFFADLFAARSLQDETAQRRLVEHNRALDMAGEGAGVIPPVWMTQEFAETARQQRRVSAAVRNIALNSAAPISMPRQTVSAAVGDQTTEGLSTGFPVADAWATAVDTVSPTATSGSQLVSRQMLDSGNPAVDALIFSDLVGAYNTAVERKVVSAMITAAGAPVVAAFATGAAWNEDVGPDSIVDAAIAVRNERKLPADIVVMNVLRYGTVLKWKDTSNRPLVPLDSAGPMNVIGTGSVAVDGRLHGLGVLATDGVPATFPESILVARAADTILFESPALRFRYEEPNGPEAIRLGIWAYTATYVKYTGDSVKRIEITA